MRLRHFLYGKDPITDDFLTLVSGSGVAKAELKYWEPRVCVLIRELRDYGVPGDFMRLLVSGQYADEWAYVRARTGGDRSRFDFQAVMLSAEELSRLGWRPWVLDGVLFSGNTNDRRVQDALQGVTTSSGHVYDRRVVDIYFDGGAAEPSRLTEKQEEMVERLVAGLGDADSAETRWYFDEGQIGEEVGRSIIARVLGSLYDMNLKVPGFVTGITSIRESSSALGISGQNDERFSDIRLASYIKSPNGSFPFENWRNAGDEHLPTVFTEESKQRRPYAGAEQQDGAPSRTIYDEPAGLYDTSAVARLPASSEDDARLNDSPTRPFPDGRRDRSAGGAGWDAGSFRSRSTAYDVDAHADNKPFERLNAGLAWLERPVSLKRALPAAVLLLALTNLLTYFFSGRVKPAAPEATPVVPNNEAQASRNQSQVSLPEQNDTEETVGSADINHETQDTEQDIAPPTVSRYVSKKSSDDEKIKDLEAYYLSVLKDWSKAYSAMRAKRDRLAKENGALRSNNKNLSAKAKRTSTPRPAGAGTPNGPSVQPGAVKPASNDEKVRDPKKGPPAPLPPPGPVASPSPLGEFLAPTPAA
ncbi:MAG TPA: hypothetical protein VD835_00920 [Pyrinomonadaceae bacterium]|nr:hypothetical protein [Pyrinomonadaceae bacterium]